MENNGRRKLGTSETYEPHDFRKRTQLLSRILT